MKVDYVSSRQSDEEPSKQGAAFPFKSLLASAKKGLGEARHVIDRALTSRDWLGSSPGSCQQLERACLYALQGGKRFRAAIVLLVVSAIEKRTPKKGDGQIQKLREPIQQDAVESSALFAGAPVFPAIAVECFHAASLIADDLPCMDNDDKRREKPASHIAFGQAPALLSSYALIACGYELLADGADALARDGVMSEAEAAKRCQVSVRTVSRCTGIQGACGGQQLDLFPPDFTEPTLLEILDKKTVTLFEISFALGWLYGGGDLEALGDIQQLSYHFGMAFQIADDLGDLEQDREREGAVNLALAMGEASARKTLNEHVQAYCNLLKKLEIATPELTGLSALLSVH